MKRPRRSRRANSTVTADDMVQWATGALAAGWDTPALRILAGLDVAALPSLWQTTPHFESALAELGMAIPERDLILRQYVDELALEILDGRIAPRVAVDTIHGVAVSPLSHPPDLQPWCYLDGGLDPDTYVQVGDHEIDVRIRAFAVEWLRSRGLAPEAPASHES